MTIRRVLTRDAPEPLGPYSQAVVHGGYVFCSGQVGIVPGTGELISGSVSEQAEQALENLREVLRASGSDISMVLKVTLYLADIRDFSAVNAVYARFLGDAKPSRTTIQVSALPKDALVAVDAIAFL